jgi:hypothetical protein|tara:strand:+ start:333 stop:647 length:315 start_codon:yes stop_codon:yes gene_type:complete
MNVIGEPIDECGPIGQFTTPSFLFLFFFLVPHFLSPIQSRLYLNRYWPIPETSASLAIHREAPPFVDQSTEMEMLVTGIKVIERVHPFLYSGTCSDVSFSIFSP